MSEYPATPTPAPRTPGAASNLSERFESAAESIAVAGCSALDQISAFCTLALSAMEHPRIAFDPEDLALALQVIQARAIEQRDYMLSEAESIGIDASTPRTVARREARRAAMSVVKPYEGEGAAC